MNKEFHSDISLKRDHLALLMLQSTTALWRFNKFLIISTVIISVLVSVARAAERLRPPPNELEDFASHQSVIQYTDEEISVRNVVDENILTGTLSFPAGPGPFTTAILVSGSGAQDRDGSVAGIKPFLTLAKHLNSKGIAVLRLDDRQTGGSTGTLANATTETFANDAEAGVTFLMNHRFVSKSRIGIVGHSEGGLVAAILASRISQLAFIVLLSTPGVSGGELLMQQKHEQDIRLNVNPQEAANSTTILASIYNAIKFSSDAKSANLQLEKIWNNFVSARGRYNLRMPKYLENIATPWMHWFLNYNPRDIFGNVRCPVLAITGSEDRKTPAAQNLPELRKQLVLSQEVTIVEIPGLNHMLGKYNPITTGSDLAPAALDEVSAWINKKVMNK